MDKGIKLFPNPSQPSTLSSPVKAYNSDQNLPKSLSDHRHYEDENEARLLTKAHSACRKLEYQMKINCKYGDDCKLGNIVVKNASRHHSSARYQAFQNKRTKH